MDAIQYEGKHREISRLPTWAQHYISDLQNKVRSAEQDRDRVVELAEPTRIMVDWEVLNKKQCYLHDQARVKFNVVGENLREYVEVFFNRDYPRVLSLHASGHMTYQMPYGNGCNITVER